jgi:hypothetical protein
VIVVEVVQQVFAAFSMRYFRFVEHGLGACQVQDAVHEQATLNEPDPTMQLRGRAMIGVFFNLIAHPAEVLELNGSRQPGAGLVPFSQKSLAVFSHGNH